VLNVVSRCTRSRSFPPATTRICSAYPRYFFSQVSTDIQELFRQTCGKLGIECANNRWNSISVARRHSVAKVDAIVGPKS
jgi:hypothetical protein